MKVESQVEAPHKGEELFSQLLAVGFWALAGSAVVHVLVDEPRLGAALVAGVYACWGYLQLRHVQPVR